MREWKVQCWSKCLVYISISIFLRMHTCKRNPLDARDPKNKYFNGPYLGYFFVEIRWNFQHNINLWRYLTICSHIYSMYRLPVYTFYRCIPSTGVIRINPNVMHANAHMHIQLFTLEEWYRNAFRTSNFDVPTCECSIYFINKSI